MKLTERKQQVLQVIQDHPLFTQQEIGDRIGITRERVRQIANELAAMGLILEWQGWKKEIRQAEKECAKKEHEYRKRIWMRMMYVSIKQRYRHAAGIDHLGLVRRRYHMPGQETVCQFRGCNKPTQVRGFCNGHYTLLRGCGALWVLRRSRSICTEIGCDRSVYARNMCILHYNKYRKNHYINNNLPINNTSGYRGVTRNCNDKRWVAFISLPGKKQEYLGTFNSKEMAARAYDTAARKQFGDHAKLNFPNENIEVVKQKRKVQKRTPSGYRGVKWHENRKRWQVTIMQDGKRVYVGSFISLELAVQARDKAISQHDATC